MFPQDLASTKLVIAKHHLVLWPALPWSSSRAVAKVAEIFNIIRINIGGNRVIMFQHSALTFQLA